MKSYRLGCEHESLEIYIICTKWWMRHCCCSFWICWFQKPITALRGLNTCEIGIIVLPNRKLIYTEKIYEMTFSVFCAKFALISGSAPHANKISIQFIQVILFDIYINFVSFPFLLLIIISFHFYFYTLNMSCIWEYLPANTHITRLEW